jgi:sec-independent protein translocase protein TatC
MYVDLINLSPVSGFYVAFQVAMYGGAVLAAPFIFYFVAAFVFPALKMKEKYFVYRGLGYGIGLFLAGVAFCYFMLLPLALTASQAYSQWLGFSAYQWKADDYISFVCKFMLGMGIGFEMPVVILTLVKIGVLNYRMLSKGRRYMIIINLVLGAVLTTPEVITQVIMFIPLQGLYEVSIWVAWYWERKEKRRLAAEEAGSAGVLHWSVTARNADARHAWLSGVQLRAEL